MGGPFQLSFWLLLMSSHGICLKKYEPLKFGEPMTLGELVQFDVDTVPLEFEDQKALNDEINYLMDYTITLMMSSAKTEDAKTKAKAKARAQMMIDLGMQLLEIQDILYSKLHNQYESQNRKKTLYKAFGGPESKHRFSQVRM